MRARIPRTAVAALAAGAAALSIAPASASAGLAWSAPLSLGSNQLTGISCPSSSLCVAVDASGDIFSSTDPAGTSAADWPEIASADPGHHLLGVSCPSTSLCAAFDDGEGVLVSTDPGAGSAASWTRTALAHSVRSISCVQLTGGPICELAGQHGEVVYSREPAGGEWSTTSVGWELDSMSCSNLPECVAIGWYNNEFLIAASATPTGRSSQDWSRLQRSPHDQLEGVSCAAGLCAIVDTEGNVITSTNATAKTPTWTSTSIDPGHALVSISCESSSFCIATDATGRVFESSNPSAASGAAWPAAAIETGALIDGGIGAVSCPSTTFCVAVDHVGNVLVGQPYVAPPAAPSAPSPSPAGAAAAALAHIQAALAQLLAPSGKAALIPALLRRGGYVTSFDAPQAGRLSITWYFVPKGAHLAKVRRAPIAIASAGVLARRSGKLAFSVRLTAAGRRLLARSARLQVTSIETFAPAGAGASTERRTFALRR